MEVISAPLPRECGGGVVQRRAERAWVVLDAALDPVEQRCRLAHELIHLDRGSMRDAHAPDTWDAVVAREERAVDREVAAWLVPVEALASLVEGLDSAGTAVTADVVALEFEVTPAIAALALASLRGLS